MSFCIRDFRIPILNPGILKIFRFSLNLKSRSLMSAILIWDIERVLSGNKLWLALFRKKSTFHGRHMNFYIQLLYMKTLLIYLIIFDTSLICQRVYERNWLNSSRACDLSSLEPKPTSLPENLLNCV